MGIKGYTSRTGVKCCDYYGNEVTSLVQWDTNRILTILNWGYSLPPVIHFTNVAQTDSYKTTGKLTNGIVSFEVPNIMLQKPDTILMFISVPRPTSDGLASTEIETIFKVELRVERRAKPSDYEYSDNADVCDLSALKVVLERFKDELERELERIKDIADDLNKIIYIDSDTGEQYKILGLKLINGKPVLLYEEVESNE